MMRVRETFAKELRRHCSLRGSIAQVCKGTGINRQQFNKYLAGQILPSASNMRRICSYLGVSEEQLMSGMPGTQAPSDGPEAASPIRGAIDSSRPVAGTPFATAARPLDSIAAANVLPLGYYDCYFPLHSASEMVVRWLLTVKLVQGVPSFTCRTYVRGAATDEPLLARRKHHGIVLPGPREAYLVGSQAMPLHQPGVIAVNTLPIVGRNYFSGLALTCRIDGPLAITAALPYRGSTRAVRDALTGLGILSLSDPALDPVIAQLMQAKPAAGSNWIQSVNGKNLRTVAPAGGSMAPGARAEQRLAY